MRQFYTARVSPARLHAALVELFADADLAYRLVDRPAFHRYTALLNAQAEAMLPSWWTLARDMGATGDAVRELQKQIVLGDGLAGKMLFTTDIWTSVASQAFMVLTGHWITSDFQLRQVVMEFEQLHGSHTGLLIAETFERVLT
ncbi:hypothetical protein CLOM_g11166 [Closterium sp. NIES-68]|nr:hypothetical protein CLOM_g11166 [Closterium sp. NIES-68]GJP79589.1 hypothetical protein CLOP_g9806 [Closterium sp. NIES-67]